MQRSIISPIKSRCFESNWLNNLALQKMFQQSQVNMALIILVLISTLFLSQTVANQFQQAALYRDKKRHVLNGNFKVDLNHQLSVTKISSSLVDDSLGCTFKCINEPKCKSFNLAANPDSNGLYVCELLDTDKYRTTANNLQANAAFHHFSPWVSFLSLSAIKLYNYL